MIERIYRLNNELDGSVFLLGAHKTGKSTILRRQLAGSVYIDLLNTGMKGRLKRRPGLLYDMLCEKPEETPVVIDEIPEVPELLDEVHRLISEKSLRFVLCGSSARKLKRKGYNTLGAGPIPSTCIPW